MRRNDYDDATTANTMTRPVHSPGFCWDVRVFINYPNQHHGFFGGWLCAIIMKKLCSSVFANRHTLRQTYIRQNIYVFYVESLNFRWRSNEICNEYVSLRHIEHPIIMKMFVINWQFPRCWESNSGRPFPAMRALAPLPCSISV